MCSSLLRHKTSDRDGLRNAPGGDNFVELGRVRTALNTSPSIRLDHNKLQAR